jgi:hypothetical protein
MKVTGITLLLSLAVSTLGCKLSSIETISTGSLPITDVPSNEILSEAHMTDVHQHEHLTESTLSSEIALNGSNNPVDDHHDNDSPRNTRLSRQADPIDDKFAKLMHLVKASKLEDCAGRVVCDLNCDSSRYGSSGKKVLDMMTKVTNSGSVPVKDMQFLVTAGLSGKMYWWTSSCGRCIEGYPDCFADSEELIEVASIFHLDF